MIKQITIKNFRQIKDQTKQNKNTMYKSKFYLLVDYIDKKQLNNEIDKMLNKIFTYLK